MSLCIVIIIMIKVYNASYLIHKVKQLWDIVSDCWGIGISLFQVFFIYFTNALHALIDGFVIGICASFRVWPGLNQENRVRLQTVQLSYYWTALHKWYLAYHFNKFWRKYWFADKTQTRKCEVMFLRIIFSFGMLFMVVPSVSATLTILTRYVGFFYKM